MSPEPILDLLATIGLAGVTGAVASGVMNWVFEGRKFKREQRLADLKEKVDRYYSPLNFHFENMRSWAVFLKSSDRYAWGAETLANKLEDMKEILEFRAERQSENPPRQPPVIRLPLPEKIDDAKKVDVSFPRSKEIDEKIVEYALELDSYQVQSSVRAQDYVETFMRANALLNGRKKVTMSDLFLYDLVHPLFLNSMGELGTENRVLSLIKQNPNRSDKEIIKMSGLSKGTFYKYKKILQGKGQI